MIHSKKCLKCGQTFSFSEEAAQALSQTEQLLCVKEGLDFAKMVKTTCTHCGTSSLSSRDELNRVDSSSPAGESASHHLTASASSVKDLMHQAFSSPGPLFNETRRAVIEKWLANFAANIEAAAEAVRTGRDVNGNAMSRQQLIDAVERMCNEYRKGLQRLEEVCGLQIRRQFEAVLSELGPDLTKPREIEATRKIEQDLPAPTQKIEPTKIEPTQSQNGGAAQTERVAPAATSTAPTTIYKIDGFLLFRNYSWPSYCACCGEHADTSKKLKTYVNVAGFEKLGLLGPQQFLTAAKKINNLEAKFNEASRHCHLKLRLPYCSTCRTHDRWAMAANVTLGAAVFVGVWGIIIGIVLLIVWGLFPALPTYTSVIVIFVAAMIILNYYFRRVYKKVAKEICAPWNIDPVSWNLKDGLGHILFTNAHYAHEFATGNGLTVTTTAKDRTKSDRKK